MDWLMICLGAGLYGLAGGVICTLAFSVGPMCLWLDRQAAWLDLLIWAIWPVAVPVCAWLVSTRERRP